jgi:Ca-activated chloride channel family protein
VLFCLSRARGDECYKETAILKKRGKIRSSPAAFLFLVTSFLWVASATAFGQEKIQEKNNEDARYDISVNAITISVTVQDKGGRYINDLTKKDFEVYENTDRRTITYFNRDSNAPISLTVLLDVSGSMALVDKFRESREALRYLVTSLLGPRDEVSLLIFADGEVEVASEFSTDKASFLSVLDKTEAYGQTALNDAVAVSPEFADKGKNEKRALLLITDGIENDSQSTPEQALGIARRVDVPIFIIGYKIPLSDQYLKGQKRAPSLTADGIVATLDRFSQATGGKAYFLKQPQELLGALREIRGELSHQYIIGYTSYATGGDEYRRIRVNTPRRKYKVRTRQGY